MSKINEKFLNVLKKVVEKIEPLNIKWALSGSVNLVLQGINLKPNDIDIIISYEDLKKVRELFLEFNPSEPRELSNKEGQDIIFRIDDVEIQVCGDYEHGTYRKYFCNNFLLNVENLKIPVFDLMSQLKCYKCTGRSDKVKLIKNFLADKKCQSTIN